MERLLHSSRKKKRASRPKVKTGCLTCKIRHVKCDETKPKCMRCINTGRECDGYAEPAASSRKRARDSTSPKTTSPTSSISSTSPEKQLVAFTGSAQEQRALEFFFHETAPQLSGFFSSRFWSGSVLQMSQSEEAIRYAMIAVSAMYEDESMNGISPVAGKDLHKAFALESYNKAIHHLIKSAKEKPESVRVPVMAAIIFICLEFLRGNVGSAITHIESGINMLKTWRRKHCGGRSPTSSSGFAAEASFIEWQLVPIFSCLNMLSSLFGRPSLAIYTNTLDAGDTFETPPLATTVAQARIELTDMVNVIVRFIQSIGESKYKSDVSIDMIVEQIRLQGLFDRWLTNYKQLLEKEAATQTDRDKLGANLIRALSITLNLWLAAALSPNETAWDQYKDDYEEIINMSQTLVPDAGSSSKDFTKRFSFEMGIIPPLHFVAWKCRWPHIRRRALNLLKASPRRECLFESYDSCAVFTRVMLVEEESLGLPPGQIPLENELPPEEYRIHQVDIAPVSPTAEGNPINFLSKPYGISGPWHPRTEYVQLGKVEFEKFETEGISFPIPAPLEGRQDASVPRPSFKAKVEYTSDFPRNFNFDEQTHCRYTGLSVHQSETLMSVGQFHPYESLETGDYEKRKITFAAKKVRVMSEDLSGFGKRRKQIAAGGLLRWQDPSW